MLLLGRSKIDHQFLVGERHACGVECCPELHVALDRDFGLVEIRCRLDIVQAEAFHAFSVNKDAANDVFLIGKCTAF